MASPLASFMLLAAVLALMITDGSEGTSNSSSYSAVEYWEKALPNVPLPAVLRNMVSPLDAATGLITHYKDMISSGRVEQPAIMCKAARLYCNTQQLEEFREVHAACVIQHGFRNGPDAYRQQQPQGSFFRESDLVEGSYVVLTDQEATTPAMSFLPRQLAELLQPVSAKLLQGAFSIPPSSLLGRESMQTSQLCKADALDLVSGEEAFCAFSLEDLADRLKTKLLDEWHTSSLELLPISGGSVNTVQAKLVKVQLKAEATKGYLSCHTQTYPFAVHFCHHTPKTRIYSATFIQSTQTAELIHAVAICHMETSDWSPLHVAFADLHSTPGHTEACHWSHQDGLIFVPTRN